MCTDYFHQYNYQFAKFFVNKQLKEISLVFVNMNEMASLSKEKDQNFNLKFLSDLSRQTPVQTVLTNHGKIYCTSISQVHLCTVSYI